MTRAQWLLALECVALFVVLPLVLWTLPMKGALFMTLWVLAFGCALAWRKQTGRTLRSLWDWKSIAPDAWGPIAMRFVLCAVAMALFTLIHDPQRLLSFPAERPLVWCMVMVLYPLLSVIPQEMIYRVFFCERYAPIFPSERMMLVASGLAFGHAHVMFNNWVAYSMSLVGGLIFAHTYLRHKSAALVWAEHALYGCFLFTIGLGWYFYSGAQVR